MAKKILLGAAILVGVMVVALAVMMHSSYGRETFALIRRMHGV